MVQLKPVAVTLRDRAARWCNLTLTSELLAFASYAWFCFPGYWIFGQRHRFTAVQVKQVLLTELLVTAESVAIKGFFALLHVMLYVGHTPQSCSCC